jgi:hypothetical protein
MTGARKRKEHAYCPDRLDLNSVRNPTTMLNKIPTVLDWNKDRAVLRTSHKNLRDVNKTFDVEIWASFYHVRNKEREKDVGIVTISVFVPIMMSTSLGSISPTFSVPRTPPALFTDEKQRKLVYIVPMWVGLYTGFTQYIYRSAPGFRDCRENGIDASQIRQIERQ